VVSGSAHGISGARFSRGGAVDRKIVQQGRPMAGNQGADQFGGEIAESDAVVAVTIGRE